MRVTLLLIFIVTSIKPSVFVCACVPIAHEPLTAAALSLLLSPSLQPFSLTRNLEKQQPGAVPWIDIIFVYFRFRPTAATGHRVGRAKSSRRLTPSAALCARRSVSLPTVERSHCRFAMLKAGQMRYAEKHRVYEMFRVRTMSSAPNARLWFRETKQKSGTSLAIARKQFIIHVSDRSRFVRVDR